MKLTTDNKQRLTTAATFFLEFYKVLMGTFLTAFVPQKCGEGVCTLTENITNTETLHLASNAFNLVTFIFVAYFYYCELKRENWCIKYLDIDETKPNDNLDDQIERYPKIKEDMTRLNKQYLNSVYLALGFLLVNFAVSGVSIGYDYVGTNTATTMVSFFLLVITKLKSAHSLGVKSVKDEHALSAYMKSAITYNVIDDDYDDNEGATASQDNVIIEEVTENENGENEENEETPKKEADIRMIF